MNLREYFNYKGIDKIEDDEEFIDAEHDALGDYCNIKDFVMSDDDMKCIVERGLGNDFDYISQDRMDNICNDEVPFYTEKWYDIDIVYILEENNIALTEENLEKAKMLVSDAFSDKSERNMVLNDIVKNYLKEEKKEK